ncbi:MAG: transporter substrate-binding domain-containing protein [Mesorhizobium sp.]|uniref:transporter substrate-binding domain-containing protein n=1 Tax=Mesorhizobium sp. TaxID=1871066 RepID=UPI000FE76FA3|nr:transporter substrate-binding domain-containing protein [Mesorhizobium sp.]RWH21122.1 MAG: transporter substrate-binding domain-containing protein [Mesorhizobium sp.]RWH38658.1 MAG: transporter substrate-binding domain-containing protein [Mesorhizobium sp.]TIM70888.1 MAG: transporter substrate-binding domain-containing protein [Mesorhizobium sp.]TIO05241.1 MAG: transporter substrate-binding domain-containing protein [Mesorhizobium sp.]TIR61897.1 MAG: transporter substrate-binding domain-con
MKILSKMTIAGALLGTWTLVAQAEQVKVGISAEPYPPFSSLDASGKWVGWEIELIGAICSEAKLECIINPVSWDGIIPSLTSKKIDVIMSSMSITKERKKTIGFSDKYYSDSSYVVAGPKGLAMDPTSEGLKGKILGVQVSTNGQIYASKHFGNSLAEIKTYQTQDEANQDLVAGRIDAVLASPITIGQFLNTEQGKACCRKKGTVANDPEIMAPGVGAGLRKGDTELREKINAAIKGIRAKGKYDKITKKYFDFDIYGG